MSGNTLQSTATCFARAYTLQLQQQHTLAVAQWNCSSNMVQALTSIRSSNRQTAVTWTSSSHSSSWQNSKHSTVQMQKRNGAILTRATTAVQPAEGPLYDLAAPSSGSAFSMESAHPWTTSQLACFVQLLQCSGLQLLLQCIGFCAVHTLSIAECKATMSCKLQVANGQRRCSQ